MKSYLIIGPDNKAYPKQLQKEYKKNGQILKVYDNSKNDIDCSNINFPSNSHIIINAHGTQKFSQHNLLLCSSSFVSTSYELATIAQKKAVSIELVSCQGGAAISAINKLAFGSSLITFASDNYDFLVAIDSEIRISSPDLIKSTNPFIRFMHYLMLNPETNKLAIKTTTGSKIFISSISNLKGYSSAEIKLWQKEQLQKFSTFCNEVKNKLPENSNVNEVLKLLEDNQAIKNWLERFNTSRFQELWLMNMTNQNNLEGIEKLLENNVDVHTKLIDGSDVIRIAAIGGSIDIIKSLHDKFPNLGLDYPNNEGGTPLYMAAQYGNADVVKFLLAKGANKKTTDLDGNNIFAIACVKNRLDVVKIQYNDKVNIEAVNKKGSTALMIASEKGHVDIIKFLLASGANIKSTDHDGDNALFPAIVKGSIAAVKILIKENIEVNHKNNFKMTPLSIACWSKNLDVIKLLLASGADPKAPLEGNHTVMDLAAQVSKDILQEIKKFNKAPIKYILKENDHANLALDALHRLEKQPIITKNKYLLEKLQKSEDCLLAQDATLELDLNLICGENGSYWSNEEF
jgi:ankyrin repeat protein